MIGQRVGNVCLSIYLFTGIPVTIYSTIELSDSVIVLYPTKFEEKFRWRCRLKSKFPRLSFLTKEQKNKKEEKMIRLEPRLYVLCVANMNPMGMVGKNYLGDC